MLTALTRRFGRLALLAVVVLAGTGVLRAVGELDGVSQLSTTSYGRAMLVKTALFAALVGMAAVARRRPRQGALLVELGAMAGLVAAVAVLTNLRPGRELVAAAASTGAPRIAPRRRLTRRSARRGAGADSEQ